MGVGSTRKRQASHRTIETLKRRVVYAFEREPAVNRRRGGRVTSRAVVGGGAPRRGESSGEDRLLGALIVVRVRHGFIVRSNP